MHIILYDNLNGRSFSIESPSENPPYSGRHGKVQSPTVPGSKRSTKNAPNEKGEPDFRPSNSYYLFLDKINLKNRNRNAHSYYW